MFKDSGKKGIFNGKYTVTYALTLDKYRDDNIKALHDFVFLDDKIAAENGEAATEGTDEAATTGETTPTPVSAPAA
jgi:hypothetical protein